MWLEVHENEFNFTKKLLCSSAVVQPFNPELTTELLTDASRLHGLGYALIQRDSNSRPRLIQCGSCSLTPAQRNYATIELECSAIVWAISKCDFYLRGMASFSIITDHRPLLGIFEKPLSAFSNDRLQRMRERLLMYSFVVTWSAGKSHSIADALSRAPYFPADPSQEIEVCATIDVEDPAMDITKNNVDFEYDNLRKCVSQGELSADLSPYKGVFDSLRLEHGFLVSGRLSDCCSPSCQKGDT